MQVRPGQRLKSVVSEVEVVVVRAPGADVDLRCAGSVMVPLEDQVERAHTAPSAEPVLIGKRYADERGTVELLCTRAGAGPLLLAGEVLAVKAAKALPASD